jgi:hypothetical protein
MKKILALALLLFAALVVFIAAGPFIALHQIKEGVQQRDAAKLSEHVDFPALRLNLKSQFTAKIMKKAPSALQDTPIASWVMDLGSKLVDGMVDTYVTPAGLASMMEGKQPKLIPLGGNASPKTGEQKPPLLRNARHGFDSPNQFSVRVDANNGGEIRFVLSRDGLVWKLSNIILPVQPE